jgi:hypothetical protein
VSDDVGDIAQELNKLVLNSQNKILEALKNELSMKTLSKKERIIRNRFRNDLRSGDWIKNFRGREILKRFTERHVKIIKYEVFRDLILARMRDANFQPCGMSRVIQAILEAEDGRLSEASLT